MTELFNRLKIFLDYLKNEPSALWLRLFFILAILLAGLVLRAYLSNQCALPYSPYELFQLNEHPRLFNPSQEIDFSQKAAKYPLSFLLQPLIDALPVGKYIIYFLGAIIIYFLGKEISSKGFGGILALTFFAFAPDNLLFYTSNFFYSGLCYILSWLSLLYLLKYLKSRKPPYLFAFFIFSLGVLLSYHTGSYAFAIIISAIFFYDLFSSGKVDKKMAAAYAFIISFLFVWSLIFDLNELLLIRNSLITAFTTWPAVLLITILIAITAIIFILKNKGFLYLNYPTTYLIILVTSLIICYPTLSHSIVTFLSSYAYITPTTFSAYFIQLIIIIISILSLFSKENKNLNEAEQIFLKGWLIGLVIVLLGLFMEGYLVRIIDFIAPLAFIVFGLFWSNKKRLRTIAGILLIVIMITTQLAIIYDKYNIRRCYSKNEIYSAREVANLPLSGIFVSDLRTAGLLYYCGQKNITYTSYYLEFHKIIFKKPETLRNYQQKFIFYKYDNIVNHYLILSKKMDTLIYGVNFPQQPLKKSIRDYYHTNYELVYDNEELEVFKINNKPEYKTDSYTTATNQSF